MLAFGSPKPQTRIPAVYSTVEKQPVSFAFESLYLSDSHSGSSAGWSDGDSRVSGGGDGDEGNGGGDGWDGSGEDLVQRGRKGGREKKNWKMFENGGHGTARHTEESIKPGRVREIHYLLSEVAAQRVTQIWEQTRDGCRQFLQVQTVEQ
ncbi:hypothetical protein PoB_004323900 [Plakobranchus ocellatus]|uniref:Uncharacterized protein n=1 Tax=Plakobranchus ocellatus TaxID=259542 RepID=A0AAV4BD50_9GAST|nr:hypothetical protein PoB_004323900 [Plakobranchus ocellatus]